MATACSTDAQDITQCGNIKLTTNYCMHDMSSSDTLFSMIDADQMIVANEPSGDERRRYPVEGLA